MTTTVRRPSMPYPRTICVTSLYMLLLWCCQIASAQINPIFRGSGQDVDPSLHKFSLTSNSDCSNEVKNIFDFESTVIGFEPETSSLNTGPTSCTIRIKSEDGFQNVKLLVKVISANILDCETQLEIVDGYDGNILDSFDCYGDQPRNRQQYPTSGDTVTFRFKRPSSSNYNFDIDLRIVRLRGGVNPDDPWGWGNDFFYDKFPQEAIVGMIGGFYGLILVICIGIIFYFNFKYQGRLKRWETHQLSTMKTGSTGFDAKSQVTEPSRVYATELSTYGKGPTSAYSRSQADTYGRRQFPRGTSEDWRSPVYDHDDSFQQSLMSNKRDQNKYRDRMATDNSTYAESEEDDPDHFEEKVITPSVRTRPRRHNRNRNHRPPSFEEAISERSSRRSSDETEDDETESSYDSTAKRRLTSSEEEEDSSEYTESETETESDEDDNSRRGRRRKYKYEKGKRRRDRRRRRSSTDGETSSHRSGPRRRQPSTTAQAGPVAGLNPAPYGAYPPGQFVPVMAGPPPAFQPVHVVPTQAPPHYATHDPHGAPRQQQQQSQVRPTDPPVYSYLVRRGYTPMEPEAGRNSPASNAGSRQGPEDEPEVPLQTGVEYMRR